MTGSPRPSIDRPIFLIGYMGCGKTTLGTAVSRMTGIPFVDLDDRIEQATGKSISQIFAEEGEEAFRSRESGVLQDLIEEMSDTDTPAIVACGGGTPCFWDNLTDMRHAGLTVYLNASVPTLARHLEGSTDRRPLLRGLTGQELEQRISDGIGPRLPYYFQAHRVFCIQPMTDATAVYDTARRFIDQFILNCSHD